MPNIPQLLSPIFESTSQSTSPVSSLVQAVGDVTVDVLPYAIGIMGILLAVSLIPRLVYKFL